MPEALELLREEAFALEASAVREPHMPVPTFIQEVEATLDFVEHDAPTRERLFKTRFREAELERLRLLVGALLSAQTAWNRSRSRTREQALLDKLDEAEVLRSDVLLAADYNTGHDRVAVARLQAIREGEGIADLIHDLLDLDVFLADFASAFEGDALFDLPAARVKLQALAADLKPLVSAASHGAERLQAKDLRDRLWTLMLEQTRFLRQSGRYAFARDPGRLVRFHSAWEIARGRRTRRRAAASSPAIT